MKVTYENKDFPDKHVFYVEQLGEFPNGTPVEVSPAQVAAYEAFTGVKFAEALKDNPNFTVGSVKGGE